MKIYVASSWRNLFQPIAVSLLRSSGFEVYDFRNPAPGDNGFHWSQVDPKWESWTTKQYIASLSHEVVVSGFSKDWNAMTSSDACLMLMPCGRSAHLEAGYFVGANKPLVILTNSGEPELMYKMADSVVSSIEEAIDELRACERWMGKDKTSVNKTLQPSLGIDKKWCMCVELKGVARDGFSTCMTCGGKDAYGCSPDRGLLYRKKDLRRKFEEEKESRELPGLHVQKYRKKPVVIEAIQLTQYNLDYIYSFLDIKDKGCFGECKHGIDPSDGQFKITTMEGVHIAKINDYIIKGVKGEFYPCNPDIFKMTYDLA